MILIGTLGFMSLCHLFAPHSAASAPMNGQSFTGFVQYMAFYLSNERLSHRRPNFRVRSREWNGTYDGR